jgi:protein-tyrosine phosphatase
MAEAVFRHMAEAAGVGRRVEVASAGTCTWHLGRPPHPGALAALARHGLCLDHKVAQSLEAVALDAFDCLVAMDRANARDAGPRAVLLLDFARPRPLDPDVPDPYYTGAFDEVYDLIETGCRGLLDRIAGAG